MQEWKLTNRLRTFRMTFVVAELNATQIIGFWRFLTRMVREKCSAHVCHRLGLAIQNFPMSSIVTTPATFDWNVRTKSCVLCRTYVWNVPCCVITLLHWKSYLVQPPNTLIRPWADEKCLPHVTSRNEFIISWIDLCTISASALFMRSVISKHKRSEVILQWRRDFSRRKAEKSSV